MKSASASSIKTRIKTSMRTLLSCFNFSVRVHLPLKQGLRQPTILLIENAPCAVRVHLPLKQGLRLNDNGYCSVPISGASASSIKTRIKTVRYKFLVFCNLNSASASSIKTRIKTNFKLTSYSLPLCASASSIKTRIKTFFICFSKVGLPPCECIFH